MHLVIDPDVKAVAEFMQSKIETRKLIGVAESLRAIAPILGGDDRNPVLGIELLAEALSLKAKENCSESQLVANESEQKHSGVGGDSEAVADSSPR